MFGKPDATRKIAEPNFFLPAQGTGNPPGVAGVAAAADVVLTPLNRVVHVYESNGETPAAYAITLPPVAECAGLTFTFLSVEDLTTYNVTIQDQDESVTWADILLTSLYESVVLFSDGLKWHRISEVIATNIQAITTSGAVTAHVQAITLNHTTDIDATIADAAFHRGLFMAKCITAIPTDTHTVVTTIGTWDGTLTTLTLDAVGDGIVVFFDDDGNGTVLATLGGAVLS